MLEIVSQPAIVTGALIACLLAALFIVAKHLGGRLPKYRIARAVRLGAQRGKPVTDLPSIARRHYGFLKRSKAASHQRSVFEFIIGLDRLIQASGVSMSLPQLGLLVGVVMAIATMIVQRNTDLGWLSASAVVVPLIGLLTWQVLVRRRATQLRRFQSIFPEALDLIVRSVRAGLPVSESIKMIGTEVADPVGAAFREVAANITIGMSLDGSLIILERKVPIPEVKFFAISLTIQQETGGNLAEILSNLASIMRKRVQIGKKIRALSSEARASALIIGSLPFIVGLAIFFLNRQYIEILYLDSTGRLFLFAALGSISFGAIVMAKLIRFEI